MIPSRSMKLSLRNRLPTSFGTLSSKWQKAFISFCMPFPAEFGMHRDRGGAAFPPGRFPRFKPMVGYAKRRRRTKDMSISFIRSINIKIK